MKKTVQVSFVTILLVMLTSCLTTRYKLGPEPSGEIIEQSYPVDRQAGNAMKIHGTQSAIIDQAVDLSEHCNGGKVAVIQIDKSLFGDSYDIKMDCAKAGGKTSKATSESKKSRISG